MRRSKIDELLRSISYLIFKIKYQYNLVYLNRDCYISYYDGWYAFYIKSMLSINLNLDGSIVFNKNANIYDIHILEPDAGCPIRFFYCVAIMTKNNKKAYDNRTNTCLARETADILLQDNIIQGWCDEYRKSAKIGPVNA